MIEKLQKVFSSKKIVKTDFSSILLGLKWNTRQQSVISTPFRPKTVSNSSEPKKIRSFAVGPIP